MLFIERILKMLKPGGRAAIVLPQGKFNNSSLAFIREWILKKARFWQSWACTPTPSSRIPAQRLPCCSCKSTPRMNSSKTQGT